MKQSAAARSGACGWSWSPEGLGAWIACHAGIICSHLHIHRHHPGSAASVAGNQPTCASTRPPSPPPASQLFLLNSHRTRFARHTRFLLFFRRFCRKRRQGGCSHAAVTGFPFLLGRTSLVPPHYRQTTTAG